MTTQHTGAARSEGTRAPLHAELDSFDAAMFRPHVGTAFETAAAESQAIDLQLTGLDEFPRYTRPRAKRISFSLVFTGPASPQLESGHYYMRHPELGDLGAIFLTPIAPPDDAPDDAAAMYYEAVFN